MTPIAMIVNAVRHAGRPSPVPTVKCARGAALKHENAWKAAPIGHLRAFWRDGTVFGMVILGMLAALPAAHAQSSAPRPAQAPAQPQELGRLFLTPQQRQDLERRRATNAQAAAVVAVDLVTVNGQVLRSGAKAATTWINGAPQDELNQGKDPARVTVRQGDDGPSASLRVGETLDRVRGETRDGLEGGKISIQPKRR